MSSTYVPVAGPGEVLVRVRAAGVNRADCSQRRGKYVVPPGSSPIIGLECSGEVVGRGEGSKAFCDGDEVCALLSGGGYAQYVAVPESHCLPIPSGLTMIDAASLMEACCTVWSNLSMRAKLRTGDSLLVHGGSSGIGVTAIQIYAAMGVRVFATAGTEAKCTRCVELGAEIAINYREQNFLQVVLDATNGVGVKAVLDIVGTDYFAKNIKVLKDDGYFVGIAAMSGNIGTLDLLDVVMRRLTITGSALRRQSVASKKAIVEEIRTHVWPLLEDKRVSPIIFSTFDLEQADEAHRIMESSEHTGKIVLLVP
ncbi:MAG: NAD(P)H-quinone oxidoreductase [Pseudomonadota bacterium]